MLPLYVSSDWSAPLPNITRAVLVLHGRLRDADVYYRSAKTAQAAAGETGTAAIMIVPQFLAGIDIDAYHLPDDTLRWSLEGWEGGDPAIAPNRASSFEALDAILARLADKRLFPNLKQVVVADVPAAHAKWCGAASPSPGQGEAVLTTGIGVRFNDDGNPSSYAYFNARSSRNHRSRRPVRDSTTGKPAWTSLPTYLATPTPAERADAAAMAAAGDLSARHARHQSQSPRARQDLHGGG